MPFKTLNSSEIEDQTCTFNSCLRVTGLTIQPWATLDIPGRPKIKETGFCNDMVDFVCKFLKLRYVSVPPTEMEYGRKMTNGSWTGVIGMLQKEKADLSSLPGSPNEDRLQAVRFSTPVWNPSLYIISGLPDDYSKDPFSYIMAFDTPTWTLFLLSFLVLAGALWCSERENRDVKKRPGITFYFWTHFCLSVYQSSSWKPTRSASRLIFGLWCLMVIVVACLFNTSMIAHLTAQEEPSRIDYFQDLLDRPKLNITCLATSNICGYFQFSKDPILSKVWSRIQSSGGALPLSAYMTPRNMNSVYRGHSTIFLEVMVAKYLFTKTPHPNDYYISKTMYTTGFVSLMASKRLDQRDMDLLDKTILYYQQSGLFQYQVVKKFFKIDLVNPWIPQEVPLNPKNLIPVFIIFTIGMSASFVTFTAEHIVFRRHYFMTEHSN